MFHSHSNVLSSDTEPDIVECWTDKENIDKKCCERIWVGKHKDDLGTFEILIPACNRDDAVDSIRTCLSKIKNGEIRVTQKIVG